MHDFSYLTFGFAVITAISYDIHHHQLCYMIITLQLSFQVALFISVRKYPIQKALDLLSNSGKIDGITTHSFVSK